MKCDLSQVTATAKTVDFFYTTRNINRFQCRKTKCPTTDVCNSGRNFDMLQILAVSKTEATDRNQPLGKDDFTKAVAFCKSPCINVLQTGRKVNL